MAEGRVVSWWPERGGGYGFITPGAGGADIFMHTGDIRDKRDLGYLHRGARVTYEVEVSERGPKAVQVKVHEPPPRSEEPEPDEAGRDAIPEDVFRSELERAAAVMVDGLMGVARSRNWLE